jgi:hypothetical protein
VEVRPGILMAAGITAGLASLTRFEGFLLIVPFALWSASRWWALRRRRSILAIGLFLGLFTPIGLLLLIHFTWLGEHAPGGPVRTGPLLQAQAWLRSLCYATVEAGKGRPAIPWGPTLAVYSMYAIRGLTVVQIALMLTGFWRWRRLLTRRDHQPVACLAVAILASMWINLWSTHGSSTRYVLLIVLLGSPFAALGLLALAERLWAAADRWSTSPRWRRIAWASPMILVAAVGIAQGQRDRYDERRTYAELGRWARREFGDRPALTGRRGLGDVAAHYAGGRFTSMDTDGEASRVADAVARAKPDVVLISVKDLEPERNPQLRGRIERLGFEPVDPAELPSGSQRVLVLVRERLGLRTACQSVGKPKTTEKGSTKL